jgi:hypothetical protein
MTHQDSAVQELNLATHRQSGSVWDRGGWDGSREPLATSRLLVGAGGVALAIQGARFRSWTGGVLAALGGTIALWALTGEGDLSGARQWLDGMCDRVWTRRQDLVHDASADSFPASDAPAWTPTVGTGIRHHAPGR